jgi:catechol 2,3-dioxygenase-like lactoylglutathione lyase family enzyme
MNSTNAAAHAASQEAAKKHLVSISPCFIVKELQSSIAYYVDRLGFHLDYAGPAGDPYYAAVSRDGIGIMLKTILPGVLPCPNRTRHEWARWDASIYALDPDALFDEFTQRGVSFVKPLSFIDDGLWGFELMDADGYVLAFFRLRND